MELQKYHLLDLKKIKQHRGFEQQIVDNHPRDHRLVDRSGLRGQTFYRYLNRPYPQAGNLHLLHSAIIIGCDAIIPSRKMEQDWHYNRQEIPNGFNTSRSKTEFNCVDNGRRYLHEELDRLESDKGTVILPHRG